MPTTTKPKPKKAKRSVMPKLETPAVFIVEVTDNFLVKKRKLASLDKTGANLSLYTPKGTLFITFKQNDEDNTVVTINVDQHNRGYRKVYEGELFNVTGQVEGPPVPPPHAAKKKNSPHRHNNWSVELGSDSDDGMITMDVATDQSLNQAYEQGGVAIAPRIPRRLVRITPPYPPAPSAQTPGLSEELDVFINRSDNDNIGPETEY